MLPRAGHDHQDDILQRGLIGMRFQGILRTAEHDVQSIRPYRETISTPDDTELADPGKKQAREELGGNDRVYIFNGCTQMSDT